MELVLATANPDKAREIGALLSGADDLRLLPRPPAVPEVEETGTTLLENARLKARALCAATGLPAVADDTGLMVAALGGAPGVYAARYAGEHATYADNVTKLLAELSAAGATDRRARFATVALVAYPDGSELWREGAVEGRIAGAPSGGGGFGYDPVFVPAEGDGRTFAEMSVEQKAACSHRGRAFRALAEALRLGRGPAPAATVSAGPAPAGSAGSHSNAGSAGNHSSAGNDDDRRGTLSESDGEAAIEDLLRSIVGKPTGTSRVVVERGPVSFFAGAVLERSDAYRTPEAAETLGLPGIPAPPTFAIALEAWGKYPELQPEGGAAKSPLLGVMGRLMSTGGLILHGEQEFVYHRPVTVGDVLVGEGKVADAYQKESKGHTMTFIVTETNWVDGETGEPVVTSRFNVIHRA